MSSPAPDSAYREVTGWFTPADVSTYLAATRPWRLEMRQDDIREIWALRDPAGGPRARIMLPLATDYADFDDRFSEAVAALGQINDWEPKEVAEHILAIRADLLHIRLEQAMATETIPLRQAEATLGAVYEMIGAAARTVAARASGRHDRSLRENLVTFLDDDLRLAHTRSGSFVFTVVANLFPEQTTVPDRTVGQETPFARSVMEELAGELFGAQRFTANTDVARPLRRLLASPDLRSVTMSFDWSPLLPLPDIGTESLQFDGRQLLIVEQLAQAPEQARELPAGGETERLRVVTLEGRVVSLATTRDTGRGPGAGEVTVSALLDGRLRRIRVALSGDDYHHAVAAYSRGESITVTGSLEDRRRRARLVGDIQLIRPR